MKNKNLTKKIADTSFKKSYDKSLTIDLDNETFPILITSGEFIKFSFKLSKLKNHLDNKSRTAKLRLL